MSDGTAGPRRRITAAFAAAILGFGLAGVTMFPEPAVAASVPSAPSNVKVTVGHFDWAEIEWQRPASDGGSEILYYLIRPNPGDPGDGTNYFVDYGDHLALQRIVEYGVTYRFSIAAVNEVGPGPYSALAAPVTPIPMVSITTTNTTEGNAGTHTATFTVKLHAPTAQPVTLDYTTGKAGAGTSFLATAGSLTFTPGQTTKTISVPILGDTIFELNEKVTVRLSNVANADFRKWTASSAILNDDAAPTLRVGDASKLEGGSLQRANAKVPVTLSFPTGAATKVHWVASNGTATGADDYALASGTLTIVKGKTKGTIAIPILGDANVERNETILVDLDAPVGATIADGHAVVTIVNDD